MWITNSPVCDIAVVWARDESGKVRGVIVERGMPGFETRRPCINGRCALPKQGNWFFMMFISLRKMCFLL
jgi:alkylation response protein AidB-like acyl-CoA dehydrogenase